MKVMRKERTHCRKMFLGMCFAAITALAILSPALADDSAEIVRYSTYPEIAPRNSKGVISPGVCRDLNNDWPSPFTNGVAWSDEVAPHRGPTYVAGKIDDANSVLWTPIQSADTTYSMFKTLVLEEGCTLCIRHRDAKRATFEDLRIAGNAEIWGPDVSRTQLGGDLWIADGTRVYICTYNNRTFNVLSELSGLGEIRFYTQNGINLYKANYGLYGMNPNFYGKISVTTRATTSADFTTYYSTLTITNALSLGGTLDSFSYDALTLYYKSKLSVAAQDIVLPAEANRGINVRTGDGRIEVPASSGTLTVNWPITLMKSTHLYKEGAGRLVLGSALRFLDKNDNFVDTSIDSRCTYYIDVLEGEAAVMDCDAFNGAKVAFSNDTVLAMSILPSDGNLRKYGVRLDKKTSPLTTDLPIRLEIPDGGLTEDVYHVSLLTVKADDEANVAEKISVMLDAKGYRLVKVTSVPGDDADTVTFKARITKKGFAVCFR